MTSKGRPALPNLRLNIWADEKGGVTASRYRTDIYENPPLPVSLDMDRSKLASRVTKTQKALNAVPKKLIWTVLPNPLAAPSTPEQRAELLECLEWVLTAGSKLYGDLAKDPDFKQILDEVDQLPDNSRLTIVTNCAFLPWEILYPPYYSRVHKGKNDKLNVFQPNQLWGNRFFIEVILSERRKGRLTPTDQHESAKPFLSLNLNPTIDATTAIGPYKPLDAHKKFYYTCLDSKKLGDCKLDADEIISDLVSDECKATIIYLYCHGRSDHAFESNQSEALQLNNEMMIEPSDISRGKFPHAPIVILNSCCSGAISPLSFSNFLATFQDKNALGLLATTFPVPSTFAAAFGQRFLRYYLKRVPVGVALLSMRRKLLRHNNPLGMFYSLQCPTHVRAPRQM